MKSMCLTVLCNQVSSVKPVRGDRRGRGGKEGGGEGEGEREEEGEEKERGEAM